MTGLKIFVSLAWVVSVVVIFAYLKMNKDAKKKALQIQNPSTTETSTEKTQQESSPTQKAVKYEKETVLTDPSSLKDNCSPFPYNEIKLDQTKKKIFVVYKNKTTSGDMTSEFTDEYSQEFEKEEDAVSALEFLRKNKITRRCGHQFFLYFVNEEGTVPSASVILPGERCTKVDPNTVKIEKSGPHPHRTSPSDEPTQVFDYKVTVGTYTIEYTALDGFLLTPDKENAIDTYLAIRKYQFTQVCFFGDNMPQWKQMQIWKK